MPQGPIRAIRCREPKALGGHRALLCWTQLGMARWAFAPQPWLKSEVLQGFKACGDGLRCGVSFGRSCVSPHMAIESANQGRSLQCKPKSGRLEGCGR